MVFKVIIAGGRDFFDYNFLKEKVDNILSSIKDEIEIVSGNAKGCDELGERYAREKGYKLKRFPANWTQYGNAAGPLRNEEMAKYADACICFWDGVSRGTNNMINNAKKHNLKLRVVNY